MRTRFLAISQLGILGILTVWNTYFGIEWGFYESRWWWDIISHVLGGMWAGLCTMWLAAEAHEVSRQWRVGKFLNTCIFFIVRFAKEHPIALCVAAATVAGVGWEIFEYKADLQGSPYWSMEFEIAKDLLDDALGGFIAGYIVGYRRTSTRKNRTSPR